MEVDMVSRDPEAVEIGRLVLNGTERWLEAGRLLAAKKDELGHGHFGEWIEANKGELGFTTLRTAQKLMAAAKKAATLNVALEPSSIWGNKSAEEKAKRRAERERELGLTEPSVPFQEISSDWPRYLGDEGLRVGRAGEHLVCADGLMRGWNAFLSRTRNTGCQRCLRKGWSSFTHPSEIIPSATQRKF